MTRKVTPVRPQDILLLPAEVGALFRVSPKTVTRWVLAGQLDSTKTVGGHHRFHEQEVRRLIIANSTGNHLQLRLQALDHMIHGRQ